MADNELPSASSALVPGDTRLWGGALGTVARPRGFAAFVGAEIAVGVTAALGLGWLLGPWAMSVACALGGAGIGWSVSWFRAAVLQQRMQDVSSASAADLAAPGRRVRVVGTILPGPTFQRASLTGTATLCRYLGSLTPVASGVVDSRHKRIEEMHGIDFSLQLEDGAVVRVLAARAYLLPHVEGHHSEELGQALTVGSDVAVPLATNLSEVQGVPVKSAVYHESWVGPKDTVEVMGIVDIAVSGEGQRLSLRDPPVVPAIRAPAREPLLVRRIAASGGFGSRKN